MFSNYIINSDISINLSLTCQASACTILSWTLGQIKIPCAPNHAKDIRNKNSMDTQETPKTGNQAQKKTQLKKIRFRPALWNMEQVQC